jgi:cytochrome c oxidase subunit 3
VSQLDVQPDSHAHDHGHDHDHPPHLGHHWENSKQQFEAGKLGMWLFLATEVLLFGGLFCAYAVWRSNHPEIFKYGSQYLDTFWGALNTCVLLISSMTMAMAVTFAARGRNTAVVICLILTLFGAGGFMCIKYIEYSHKFHEGLLPGMAFYEQPNASHLWLPIDELVDTLEDQKPMLEFAEDDHVPGAEPHLPHPLQDPERPANAQKFFTIYFLMTGLHGIHVIAGGFVIAWLLLLTLRGRFSKGYYTPIDLGGLYWHNVDVIWIFLFPLFYLI